jgi:hypothetical protein
MTAEALIAHYALWAVAALFVVWAFRCLDARTRSRQVAVFAGLEDDRRNLQQFIDGIERRAEERAETSRRRLDQLLAEAGALANDPHAGDEPDSPPRLVTISVTMPADTPPGEVDAVVQTLRTATGHRFPIHIDAPTPTG